MTMALTLPHSMHSSCRYIMTPLCCKYHTSSSLYSCCVLTSSPFAAAPWPQTEPARTVEPVSRLAPDALTEMPTLQDFETAIKGMSRKKALKIKALLLTL